jgi:CMP-N,N'-diacetyllegionaminic acid synthase
MKQITAVIPVRQGSERIKNKNFKPFAGKTLLEHKIETIMQLPVHNIIVNTDSEYAIEVAKHYGLDYHKREAYYASSACTNSEYHVHLAQVTNSEHMLVAPVTSPLIQFQTYIEAMDLYNIREVDSLISVNAIQHYLWHNDMPLNYNPKEDIRSQELPRYYKPTYGIILCKNAAVIANQNFICKNNHFYEVSDYEAIDIDNNIDFDFAEFLFKKQNL